MAKNYLSKGTRINIPENTITSAVSSGDVVTIQKLVGVALHDGAANAANVLKVDGEWNLKKATGAGTGGNIGADAYVTSAGLVTAVSTGNNKIGVFTAAAVDGDTTANIRLNAIGIS